MNVTSREMAWAEVNKIFPPDYEKDEGSSQLAGYDIYRHPTLNYYCRICDLGNRLEVLTGEYGENVINIWIRKENPMKQYTITIKNGNYPLIYKCNQISEAYGCMKELSEGLLKDRDIDLNDIMRNLVRFESETLTKTENYFWSIEVEGVE